MTPRGRAMTLVLALATATLAGCLAQPSAPLAGAPPAGLPVEQTFTDRISGSVAAAGRLAFDLAVPAGATELRAALAWTSEAAALDVVLRDPAGEEVERGFAESATRRAFATVDPPAPGTWVLEVVSTNAQDEPFTLDAAVTAATATAQTIEDAYALPMRFPLREVARVVQPASGFAEINLILEEGQGFNYTWTSTQPVYFNIHYHDSGQTVRAVEENTTSLEGAFTAPFRQVFSLLWRNDQPLDATVEAAVEGVFREHSRTRDAQYDQAQMTGSWTVP